MLRLTVLLASTCSLVCVQASAQSESVPAATMPPLPPPALPETQIYTPGVSPIPKLYNPEADKLSPIVREKIEKAHALWKTSDGGEEFQPSRGYVAGLPFVVLVTSKEEPADKQKRRQRAMLTVCESLLDEDAFVQAAITVIEYDHSKPDAQALRTYVIERSKYRQATKTAGKSENLREALQNVRNDETAVSAACAALGIK